MIQYKFNNIYYDFHNDYYCQKLFYSDNELFIYLNHIEENKNVIFNFINVTIANFSFYSQIKETEGFTIDTLYRGRFEAKGKLKELSDDSRGYFYLEFYEGQKIEFWAEYIVLKTE